MKNPTEEVVNNAKANADMISGDMELKTALMDRFHQMHNKFKAADADASIYYNRYSKEIVTSTEEYSSGNKQIPIYYFSNTRIRWKTIRPSECCFYSFTSRNGI